MMQFDRTSVKTSRIKKVEWWRCWAEAGESLTCIGLGNKGEGEEGAISRQSMNWKLVHELRFSLHSIDPEQR